MNRKIALSLAFGCCLVATGCITFGDRTCQSGCPGGRCSNCIPPWLPCWKYCQVVDDIVVWETGKNCGIRALARYKHQTGNPVSADFGAGFIQSHIDLAEGRSPLPPSVPPSCYWTAYYRSCAGQPRVEQWYAGYQAGLEEGLQGGVSQFRRIDVRLNGNNCQGTNFQGPATGNGI